MTPFGRLSILIFQRWLLWTSPYTLISTMTTLSIFYNYMSTVTALNIFTCFEHLHLFQRSPSVWKILRAPISPMIHFEHRSPEGRPGMSDVTFLSGISGLSFDSPFLSSFLFFSLVLLLFLSCHLAANGPFSWLFQKTLKYFSLRVRLFCMALVEQLGDDSW